MIKTNTTCFCRSSMMEKLAKGDGHKLLNVWTWDKSRVPVPHNSLLINEMHKSEKLYKKINRFDKFRYWVRNPDSRNRGVTIL